VVHWTNASTPAGLSFRGRLWHVPTPDAAPPKFLGVASRYTYRYNRKHDQEEHRLEPLGGKSSASHCAFPPGCLVFAPCLEFCATTYIRRQGGEVRE
jgi:hypothetical protein